MTDRYCVLSSRDLQLKEELPSVARASSRRASASTLNSVGDEESVDNVVCHAASEGSVAHAHAQYVNTPTNNNAYMALVGNGGASDQKGSNSGTMFPYPPATGGVFLTGKAHGPWRPSSQSVVVVLANG